MSLAKCEGKKILFEFGFLQLLASLLIAGALVSSNANAIQTECVLSSLETCKHIDQEVLKQLVAGGSSVVGIEAYDNRNNEVFNDPKNLKLLSVSNGTLISDKQGAEIIVASGHATSGSLETHFDGDKKKAYAAVKNGKVLFAAVFLQQDSNGQIRREKRWIDGIETNPEYIVSQRRSKDEVLGDIALMRVKGGLPPGSIAAKVAVKSDIAIGDSVVIIGAVFGKESNKMMDRGLFRLAISNEALSQTDVKLNPSYVSFGNNIIPGIDAGDSGCGLWRIGKNNIPSLIGVYHGLVKFSESEVGKKYNEIFKMFVKLAPNRKWLIEAFDRLKMANAVNVFVESGAATDPE